MVIVVIIIILVIIKRKVYFNQSEIVSVRIVIPEAVSCYISLSYVMMNYIKISLVNPIQIYSLNPLDAIYTELPKFAQCIIEWTIPSVF